MHGVIFYMGSWEVIIKAAAGSLEMLAQLGAYFLHYEFHSWRVNVGDVWEEHWEHSEHLPSSWIRIK